MSLSLANGETRASLTTTMVNSDRQLKLYNNAGSVQWSADDHADGEGGDEQPGLRDADAEVRGHPPGGDR